MSSAPCMVEQAPCPLREHLWRYGNDHYNYLKLKAMPGGKSHKARERRPAQITWRRAP